MIKNFLQGGKYIVAVTIAILIMVAPSAQAYCPWGMVEPGRVFEPVDATDAFLAYDKGIQTVVMKPEFKGNAADFAIIYPTPGRPEVTEGPKSLFTELDDATNPIVRREVEFFELAPSSASLSFERSVTVIEQKDVGDYTATVLTATDATDLLTWLKENGYNFTQSDLAKMDYYVQRIGFYFIALKVNMSRFVTEKKTLFNGQLEPIQFTFAADRPQLPMRTLKSDMGQMTFDLYTLGNEPIYIPGVSTVWSNIVDQRFLSQTPSLNKYAPKGKWLLRQEVKFSPKKRDQDVFLPVGEAADFRTANPSNQIIISPQDLDPQTGILPGKRGTVVLNYTFDFDRNLRHGSVGEDVLELQKLLNRSGFKVAESGAGSPGRETRYFGNLTKQALIRYQNFYRQEILEPLGLRVGTGFFGPATRNHINKTSF